MQQGPFYNPPSHGIMGFMKPKGSAIGLRYFTLKADLFQEQIKKSIEMMRFLFCEHPICQLLYPPIPPSQAVHHRHLKPMPGPARVEC